MDRDGFTTRLPSSGMFSIRVDMPKPGVTKIEVQPSDIYRLISVPLDLDDKQPRAVLEDDLGTYDDTQWRFFVPEPSRLELEIVWLVVGKFEQAVEIVA